MNIAVFHDLPSGGAKRALVEQVRGLIRLGHRVDAFVPATANEEFLPLAAVATSVRTYALPAPPDRARMLEGRPHLLDPFRWVRQLMRVRRVATQIGRDIDAGNYDVALVHPSQFTQAPWLLRRLRTPCLYYCHEPLRAAYEPRIATPLVRFLIQQTLGRVDRRNLRAASAVAVNSAFTAANVQRIYDRPARVIYLGVDAGRFRSTSALRGDYILTVGGVHPLKGLAFLIDALGHIARERRPPLIVVSDRARETERQRLVARAQACGVDLRFRFQVTEDELVALYNGARLVVYTPYAEPFGFVPLEAMACARPVLAVRDGGIAETVIDGETGFLMDRDVAQFARRLDTLLNDAAGTEDVARRAASLVRERWTWDRSVGALEQLCAETAAAAVRPGGNGRSAHAG